MTTCKECRHWTPMTIIDGGTGEELGPCEDSGRCADEHLQINGPALKNGLVCDACLPAWIGTGPDFGCVHGVAR